MGLSKLVSNYHTSGNKSHSNGSDSSHAADRKSHKEHAVELSIDIESPPCVLYGAATESSGALLSGLLTLNIKDPYATESIASSITPVNSSDGKGRNTLSSTLSTTLSHLSLSSPTLSPVQSSTNMKIMSGYTKVAVKSVTLTLVQKFHFHKPFLPDLHSAQTCMNCKSKTTDMKRWEIQKTVTDLSVGKHSYPFSYLIPGSVPAKSSLGLNSETQIKYELIAVATYKDPHRGKNSHSNDQLLQLSMPISVTRSIPRGPDKNSLRVFPPTELTAMAVLPNVIYPKSTFPLELKLNGVSSSDRRWRMRKLGWRIEEVTRVRSNACKIHKHELKQLEKTIGKKESEKSKKPGASIKRYGDSGPHIRVSVATAENAPLPSTGDPTAGNAPADNSNNPGDQDQEDEEPNDFIHPNDDALRQEISLQQQLLREQQIEQELKNSTKLFIEETRTIARGEMKSGWKTDFDNSGQVELITDIDCMTLNSGVTNPITNVSTSNPHNDSIKQQVNVSCDIQDPTLGIYVNHILAVEIVVAEEALQYANGQPIKKSESPSTALNVNNVDQRLAELSPMFANRNQARGRPVDAEAITPVNSKSSVKSNGSSKGTSSPATGSRIIGVPTGAARVLRMQFRLNFTERSGLGISWDEEVPPIYQDVKLLSPPSYENVASKRSLSQRFNVSTDDTSTSEVSTEMTSSIPQKMTPPPLAHHHNSTSSFRALSAVQSPQLDNIISIQGNVPFHDNILTPHATRDIVRVRNVSELLETDRITQ